MAICECKEEAYSTIKPAIDLIALGVFGIAILPILGIYLPPISLLLSGSSKLVDLLFRVIGAILNSE